MLTPAQTRFARRLLLVFNALPLLLNPPDNMAMVRRDERKETAGPLGKADVRNGLIEELEMILHEQYSRLQGGEQPDGFLFYLYGCILSDRCVRWDIAVMLSCFHHLSAIASDECCTLKLT